MPGRLFAGEYNGIRMALTPGTKLGPYEIIGPLGIGGMGEVYRARDARLDRSVAIKILPAALSTDRDRLRRFEQEARSASALNHPNIITIHELGQHGSTRYIAMELVEGKRCAICLLRARCRCEKQLKSRHRSRTA